MCGRFALTTPLNSVAEIFDAVVDPALVDVLSASGEQEDEQGSADAASPLAAPQYNICPTQQIAVIRAGAEGRTLSALRWGFLPSWYKAPNGGPLLINARSETLATKRAFARSARERRCLIPATGFYEWRTVEGPAGKPVKQPFWLSPAPDPSNNRPVVAFGGIWRTWTGPDGATLTTCAIVTTASNEVLKDIHHRLPLAIAPDDWGLWLGEEGRGAALLMKPAEDAFWAFHEVAPEVNKSRADGPELMTPLETSRLI
ncbi:MAG: SOS response-associated peptidase [Pseudomonadota bacterium]